MAIVATTESKKRVLTPEGNHIARCVQMIHLGTSEHTFEKDTKTLNKVRLVWEIPGETYTYKKDDEEIEACFMIGKDYTLSMHSKASLRKDLKSWRGKDFTEEEAKAFDVTKLLGVGCMLNVLHKTSGENTYANISSIATLPKGMKAPEQVNPSFEFNFEDKFSEFDNLPEWLQDKVKLSDEYLAKGVTETDTNDTDENGDPLPF